MTSKANIQLDENQPRSAAPDCPPKMESQNVLVCRAKVRLVRIRVSGGPAKGPRKVKMFTRVHLTVCSLVKMSSYRKN